MSNYEVTLVLVLTLLGLVGLARSSHLHPLIILKESHLHHPDHRVLLLQRHQDRLLVHVRLLEDLLALQGVADVLETGVRLGAEGPRHVGLGRLGALRGNSCEVCAGELL